MNYDKAEKQAPPSPTDSRSATTVSQMQTDHVYEVSKYSWQDGSKKVTLYFDPSYGGGTGECEERLLEDTLTAEFTPISFTVNYTSVRANNTALKVKRQFRVPLLYGDIKPNKCTYEITRNKKDKTRKLIVVKLVKASKLAWQDLEGKEDRNAAHDDYSEGDHSDNNDPRSGSDYPGDEGHDYANNYANAESENNNNGRNNASTYNNFMSNNGSTYNDNFGHNNGSAYNNNNNFGNNNGSRYGDQNAWSSPNQSVSQGDQPKTRRQSMLEVQDLDI